MAKLQARMADIDAALADPAKATGPLKGMNLGAMGKLRDDLEAELARVEAQWLAWSEQVDA